MMLSQVVCRRQCFGVRVKVELLALSSCTQLGNDAEALSAAFGRARLELVLASHETRTNLY